jgi:hypothetical protein
VAYISWIFDLHKIAKNFAIASQNLAKIFEFSPQIDYTGGWQPIHSPSLAMDTIRIEVKLRKFLVLLILLGEAIACDSMAVIPLFSRQK